MTVEERLTVANGLEAQAVHDHEDLCLARGRGNRVIRQALIDETRSTMLTGVRATARMKTLMEAIERVGERDPDQAPPHLDNAEAAAWASGYASAVARIRRLLED
jgi:hypothetical protein